MSDWAPTHGPWAMRGLGSQRPGDQVARYRPCGASTSVPRPPGAGGQRVAWEPCGCWAGSSRVSPSQGVPTLPDRAFQPPFPPGLAPLTDHHLPLALGGRGHFVGAAHLRHGQPTQHVNDEARARPVLGRWLVLVPMPKAGAGGREGQCGYQGLAEGMPDGRAGPGGGWEAGPAQGSGTGVPKQARGNRGGWHLHWAGGAV